MTETKEDLRKKIRTLERKVAELKQANESYSDQFKRNLKLSRITVRDGVCQFCNQPMPGRKK